MVYQKVSKKGNFTLGGLVMGLLIIIGFFTMGFLFINQKVAETGLTVDPNYAVASAEFDESLDDIDTQVTTIKEATQAIRESDPDVLSAWNGLKGLGSALLLPITFINASISILEATLSLLTTIPASFKIFFSIAAIAMVIFLVLSILKGEPKLLK